MFAKLMTRFAFVVLVMSATSLLADENEEKVTFKEILDNSISMTEVQWSQYAKSFSTKQKVADDWNGTVIDVRKTNGQHYLYIFMDEAKDIQNVHCVAMPIDEEKATKWNKGQFVEFSGVIGRVSRKGTLVVIID